MKSRFSEVLLAGTLLPILSVAAGILTGIANAHIWQALGFSFSVLSALAMALLGFFAIGVVIEKLTLPYPKIAFASGLLFAVASYFAYRYADYQLLRGSLPRTCFEGATAVACPWAAGGWPGFLGYLAAVAEQGIELLPGHLYVAAEMGAPVRGATIRSVALWGLWFIELAFVAGLTSWGLWSVARQPFCRDCGRWFASPTSIGKVPRASVDDFLARIRGGDLAGAGRLVLQADQAGAGDLSVLKALCPGCRGAHVHLSATRIINRPQGMFPMLVFAKVIDAAQFAAFTGSNAGAP